VSRHFAARKGAKVLLIASPSCRDRLSTRHPLSMADNLDTANAEGKRGSAALIRSRASNGCKSDP